MPLLFEYSNCSGLSYFGGFFCRFFLWMSNPEGQVKMLRRAIVDGKLDQLEDIEALERLLVDRA